MTTLNHDIKRNFISNNDEFKNSLPGQLFSSNPLGFIDVGARGGVHDLVDPIANITAVLGFEPDKEECQRLMSIPEVYTPWAKFILEPVAVADKIENATLHLLSANTNHSLLRPNPIYTKRYIMPKWEEVGEEPLKTNLIDNIVYAEQYRADHFGEFIKLDTQGTEYEVLNGSQKMLDDRTVAIVTEVAFCELYQGQKLFSDVECFLREAGFSFYGFSRSHSRSCRLLDKTTSTTAERLFYADAVFFKDPYSTPNLMAQFTDRKFSVLYTTALLLGYYDFAFEVAKKTFADTEQKLSGVKSLISSLAYLPPENTISELKELSSKVDRAPELANVIVGGFVDQRRKLCNYDDVLSISVLPKTL
jgi:FkbM family methyltransferase